MKMDAIKIEIPGKEYTFTLSTMAAYQDAKADFEKMAGRYTAEIQKLDALIQKLESGFDSKSEAEQRKILDQLQAAKSDRLKAIDGHQLMQRSSKAKIEAAAQAVYNEYLSLAQQARNASAELTALTKKRIEAEQTILSALNMAQLHLRAEFNQDIKLAVMNILDDAGKGNLKDSFMSGQAF